MYYIVPTQKSVGAAARDLEAAVQKHGFGVLHVYDLKETLTRKGHPLDAECRIYEVCNPKHASEVLRRDMRLNAALPCRISVFEDGGTTKIGTILPTTLLGMLSPDPRLRAVAAAVEAALEAIIDEASGTAEDKARLTLLARRATLSQEIEAGVRKRDADREGMSGANVADRAELAASNLIVDVDLAEVDRDVAELRAIDAAVKRLDAHTYGICTDCGTAIDAARLIAAPAAARCVVCQRRAEAARPTAPPRL